MMDAFAPLSEEELAARREDVEYSRYIYVYFDPSPIETGRPVVAGAGFFDCPKDWDKETVAVCALKSQGLELPGAPQVRMTIFEANTIRAFEIKPGAPGVLDVFLEGMPSSFEVI